MFARNGVLLGLACLLLGRPADADVDRLTGLLDGPATDASIFQASAKLRGCVANECLAMHDIANAFHITTRRDLPNTMVHLTPQTGDPSRIANLSLNRTLLAYPDRKASYCRILTLLSRHFAQWSVGMVAVELANRIDGSGSRCTQNVVAALSQASEGRRVVESAHESCVAENRPGCDRDVLQ